MYVVFSEFKNVLAPHLAVEKLLPVEAIERGEETQAEVERAQIDYIYEQPEGADFKPAAAEVRGNTGSALHAGILRRGACGAHDGDGRGDQECRRGD